MSDDAWDLDPDNSTDRLYANLFGAPDPPPALPAERPLDEILASRTHVRVLRVLITLDRHMNLSGRGVARKAGVSRGRVLTVLRHLGSLGIVTITWTPHAALYRMADASPLVPALRSLFLWEREHEGERGPGATSKVDLS